MKEKIKKILRIIITIIAILWIFSETASDWTDWQKIVGVLAMWGIAIHSLREKKFEKLT